MTGTRTGAGTDGGRWRLGCLRNGSHRASDARGSGWERETPRAGDLSTWKNKGGSGEKPRAMGEIQFTLDILTVRCVFSSK